MGMKRRCLNFKRGHAVTKYGAIGITVCQRWWKYENFLADMGECPPRMTLDRIDNAKDYEPGNCRWATFSTQSENRSIATMLTHDGVTLNISGWSRRTGIRQVTIGARIRRGWSVQDTLTKPLVPKQQSAAG